MKCLLLSVASAAAAAALLLACVVDAKVCYEPCDATSRNDILSADVIGCRRRPGRNGRPAMFWCRGIEGPPCFAKRKDRMRVTFEIRSDLNVTDAVQEVMWVTPYGMMLPWAGMEPNACKYITKCEAGKGTDRSVDVMTYSYPLQISAAYPSGYFNLKWMIYALNEGVKEELACVRVVLEIV